MGSGEGAAKGRAGGWEWARGRGTIGLAAFGLPSGCRMHRPGQRWLLRVPDLPTKATWKRWPRKTDGGAFYTPTALSTLLQVISADTSWDLWK